MPEEIKQKSIEQYSHEMNIPEDKKEKVVMLVTKMVYERNQNVITWEKTSDPEEKKKLESRINEKDDLIKKKINEILAGKEEEAHYDF